MGWFLILAFLGVTALQYLLNRGNRSKAQTPGPLDPPRTPAGTPIPVIFGTAKVSPLIVAFSLDKVRKLEKPVGFLPAPFQEKQFLGWSRTVSYIGLLGWGPLAAWADLLFDQTKLFSQEPNSVGVVTVGTGSIGGMDPSTLTITVTGKGSLSGHASILLPYVFGGEPPEGQGGIADGRDYTVAGHLSLTAQPSNMFFFTGQSGAGAFTSYPAALDTLVNAYAPVGQPFSFAAQPTYARFGYTALDWVDQGTAEQLHTIEHVVTSALGGNMIGDDANPINVLSAILTDQEWGLGISEALIDATNFGNAQVAIGPLAEAFGISGVMNEQKAAEDYIAEILRTIDAALYRHPETGKLCVQLIRADYVVSSLAPLNETNVKACEWTRRDIGDTVNQVVIAFTDRNWMFERNTVTLTDHANVAVTGSVRSTTIEFPWISTEAQALKVGARELKANTLPLDRGTLIVDRDSWDAVPGDVRKLSWARFGLVDVPVRINSMSAGTLGDGSIEIDVVEDVYGFPDVPFTVADAPPSTVGNAGSETSTPKVQTFPTADATTGYLTLVVTDPESRVTDVSFSTQIGTTLPSGFVTDATLPYSTTVPLDPSATSYIYWQVTWTDSLSVSQVITGAVPYGSNASAPGSGSSGSQIVINDGFGGFEDVFDSTADEIVA
jgi:hypothetical protein